MQFVFFLLLEDVLHLTLSTASIIQSVVLPRLTHERQHFAKVHLDYLKLKEE